MLSQDKGPAHRRPRAPPPQAADRHSGGLPAADRAGPEQRPRAAATPGPPHPLTPTLRPPALPLRRDPAPHPRPPRPRARRLPSPCAAAAGRSSRNSVAPPRASPQRGVGPRTLPDAMAAATPPVGRRPRLPDAQHLGPRPGASARKGRAPAVGGPADGPVRNRGPPRAARGPASRRADQCACAAGRGRAAGAAEAQCACAVGRGATRP